MSKVTVEFDTLEKTVSVSINGKPVPDVSSVEFYRSYDRDDEFRCGIMTVSKDEENDMRVVTHLVAHEEESISMASELPGFFVKSSKSKVQNDIENCFQ